MFALIRLYGISRLNENKIDINIYISQTDDPGKYKKSLVS